MNGDALVEPERKHDPNETEGENGELLGQFVHVLLERCSWGLFLHHHAEELPKLALLPCADDDAFAPTCANEGPHVGDISQTPGGSIGRCGDLADVLERNYTQKCLKIL